MCALCIGDHDFHIFLLFLAHRDGDGDDGYAIDDNENDDNELMTMKMMMIITTMMKM